MAVPSLWNASVTSGKRKRDDVPHTSAITRCLDKLVKEPQDGFLIMRGEDDYKFEALVEGPRGSPYDGGLFRVLVIVPPNYPFNPPRVTLKTFVYHPSINSMGRIYEDQQLGGAGKQCTRFLLGSYMSRI